VHGCDIKSHVRYEVMAVNMTIMVFWYLTPYSFVDSPMDGSERSP
jgi:hypothetical protein